MDFLELSNLLKTLKPQQIFVWFLGWGGVSFLVRCLIVFFSQHSLKSIFRFKTYLFEMLCIAGLWLLCLWLEGYENFTFFVFGFLVLFYVLARLDEENLAIPDSLNFLMLFYVLIGLFYFEKLDSSHLVALFCASGAFALLKIFGSFVFGKEIMGEADIVVVGSLACYIGLLEFAKVVFLSSVLALCFLLLKAILNFKNRQVSITHLKLPFVSFLMLGFVGILIDQKCLIWEKLNV